MSRAPSSSLLFIPEFPEPDLYSLACIKFTTIESVFPQDANHVLQNVATRPTKSLLVSLDHQPSDDLYLLLTSYYREGYGQIRRVIGEDVLAPLPESDEVLSREDEYRSIWKYIASSGMMVESSYNTLIPMLMKQALNPVPRTWIAGRRFARLCGGELAIVPPATRSGDEIYAFALRSSSDDYFNPHLLVLRPYPAIPRADISDLNRGAKRSPGDGRHFTMVGLARMGFDCAALRFGLMLLEELLDGAEYFKGLDKITHAIIH